MGDWLGTPALALREEGCERVLSTGCCVLNYTLMESLCLLGRSQGWRGSGEESIGSKWSDLESTRRWSQQGLLVDGIQGVKETGFKDASQVWPQ